MSEVVKDISVIPGIFIKATSLLESTLFEAAVIYIVGLDENGATGFVVNKIFHRRFNELAEFASYPPFEMYEGGPVDPLRLYFLHQRPDLIKDGKHVTGDIYFGGDFKQAIDLLRAGTISADDVRILKGYCGWDNGELEREIGEGSWVIHSPDGLFS